MSVCGIGLASGRHDMMDIERLIEEVRIRPAIWDQKVTAYYNRDIVSNTWKEVAEACGMPREAVRCKWKHLRDNFRKEFKKCAKEAEEGTDPENFQSGWVWYNNLHFLGDQLVARKTNPYKKTCKRKTLAEDSVGENQEIGFAAVKDEMCFEDNALSLYSPSVDTARDIGIPEVELRYDDDDSKKLSDSLDSDYDFKSRNHKLLTYGADRSDDTYHFVMSLMNPIKSLPYNRQMYVRLKIQELLFNETVNSDKEKSDRTVDFDIGMNNDLNDKTS